MEMEPADSHVPVLEQEGDLSTDGRKRPSEMAGSDSGVQLFKKASLDCCNGSGGVDEMRRVAEIAMVLSALGKMRGGRSPSGAERGLMAEAREKLSRVCEPVAPKDLIPSDAVRAVVDDLGFNKVRDVRTAFRPPKLSIAEKVSLMKRKIEESKELNAQTTPHSSQQLQVGISSNSDGHGTFFDKGAVHNLPSDKSCPVPLSAGGFQPASPVVFVSAIPAPSSLNQSQVSVMQPAFVLMPSFSGPLENVSSSLPSQMEAAHFRLDAQPAYLFQVQASSSGNHMPEASPTCTSQSPSVTGSNVGEAIKLADHNPALPEGAHELNSFQLSPAIRDLDCKTSAAQTTSGNIHTVHQPFQAVNFVHASAPYNNHNDIARNVQKILQPRVPDHSNWITPSVDYMIETLTCQMCKASIIDVENIVVCDNCEKGYHIKCLEPKGIPKSDWYCTKCVNTSTINGKPLPPKYGRVTRNSHASRVLSNNSGVRAPADRKIENPVQKANHLKTIANGKPDPLKSAHMVGPFSNNCIEPVPDQKMPNAREGENSSISGMKIEGRPFHRTCSKSHNEKAVEACFPGSSNETTIQHIQNSDALPIQIERVPSALKSQPEVETAHSCHYQPSEAASSTCHRSQASWSSVSGKTPAQTGVEVSADQLHGIGQNTSEELKRASDLREPSECKPGGDVKRVDLVVARLISNGSVDNGNGGRHGSISSLDGMHSVDWVGDALEIVDGKAYYASCCINGAVYKLQDRALFSNNKKLSPVKLEVLWEDNKTGSKWATVNHCYFPSDLPAVVGRPCTPEYNEVYESNHRSTIMVGLIHGPCEVLSPDKYREENERRTSTGHGANYGFHPIFQCKWFYDESKGLFQPFGN
ncbi:hypothetical protein MRB53_002206 [Persea americana]|uniref:Uncharacterized protein n=1 Tax=Persea americana TaxID=3435 RepID=A0ACC2MUS0_PERAE|nr:hypothetical protein MRB53_002206 [Persea americana]|eukprot:TRINITY_DN6999_c0_g2_i1.p1 TRINITY_DN6999_c0_g2~~TRINITY_DN6999_c0_g2_i1.p1  ORF type:complete len:867 (+),score=190.23 TRINITY_DN6999_c0_g2_i1:247-2847(+)